MKTIFIIFLLSILFFKLKSQENNLPNKINEYNIIYHSLPIMHGNSDLCWAFSSISFLESEIYRIHNKRVKLSEAFIIYCEYLEKAEYFYYNRGRIILDEASLNGNVIRIAKKYGLVPYQEYSYYTENKIFSNEFELFNEFSKYLYTVKKSDLWVKEIIMINVKNILDKYLGVPPQTFSINGNIYNPKSYIEEYLKINLNNYFNFMSKADLIYNERNILADKRNWLNSNDFYNIALNDFKNLFNKSITNGYSVSACFDTEDIYLDGYKELVDLSMHEYNEIDDNDEIFFKKNYCCHIVGYKNFNGENWYLVKDSNKMSFIGNNKGYMFYHQDFIRLKMTNFLINVEPARDILNSIIK